MNYQIIIDHFLPNEYTIITDWKDPETDELVAIALFKRSQGVVPNFNEPEFIVYQFEREIPLVELGLDNNWYIRKTSKTMTVFEFGEFVDGELIPLGENDYETLREAFIELIRFIINRQLDSFFDDPNI